MYEPLPLPGKEVLFQLQISNRNLAKEIAIFATLYLNHQKLTISRYDFIDRGKVKYILKAKLSISLSHLNFILRKKLGLPINSDWFLYDKDLRHETVKN